jgi:hypothetical protein
MKPNTTNNLVDCDIQLFPENRKIAEKARKLSTEPEKADKNSNASERDAENFHINLSLQVYETKTK